MAEDRTAEAEPGLEALSILPGLTTAAKPPPLYTAWDRYRDFRAVLLNGTASEHQAQRVLYLILDHLGVLKTPMARAENAVDPLATFHAIGRQDAGRWLLGMLTTEPREQPEQTISEKPER
jgi:hypothetical protein